MKQIPWFTYATPPGFPQPRNHLSPTPFLISYRIVNQSALRIFSRYEIFASTELESQPDVTFQHHLFLELSAAYPLPIEENTMSKHAWIFFE
ncbi:hypothetical protein WA026_001667 [Henosepilachna vigintioctopunctata]|uniref:Uncharacterized protein n=1 Tax=Henosepilachna vigintioctopunctata TaxID=420089 RepID=A0AAW1UL89_9CUCU